MATPRLISRAAEEPQPSIPELSRALIAHIEREREENSGFARAFSRFFDLCKQSLNHNIAEHAVEELLVQHLLTERIFRKLFDNPDFVRRNVIAAGLEQVTQALGANLERFHCSTEDYERFLQGFSTRRADQLGVVYTPAQAVEFMIRGVEHILKREFGRSLNDQGVHILDPFVGTGNFIVHLMRALDRSALPWKYRHELHCHELMLLPYHIASLNIEREYEELTGTYEPFKGARLVDTFELAEQGGSPVFVVIGNPPYNATQVSENDNNKNRRYRVLDQRVRETYIARSKARLRNKYGDPYIKALRWASDRIGEEGIVALITNSSFIHKVALDGVRASLSSEFDQIYILDLGGSVRDNPRLSGTVHNIFGILSGVSINFLVRRRAQGSRERRAEIRYSRLDEYWRRDDKLHFLSETRSIAGVQWHEVEINARHDWVGSPTDKGFSSFIPLADRTGEEKIFSHYSLGISTNRDRVVYDFNVEALRQRIERFCEDYNDEVERYHRKGKGKELDDFLDYSKIKWSRNLKRELKNVRLLRFKPSFLRTAMYRPFSKRHLYFADTIIDEPGRQHSFFPSGQKGENQAIGVSDKGFRAPFSTLVVDVAPDLHLCASTDGFQFFPFYVYDESGKRNNNITDWALSTFRSHYEDDAITRWDIFHYVYAVLHHPGYRKSFQDNLKKELPRIPLLSGFRRLAKAGARLAHLHTGYEEQDEYPLERVEAPDQPLSYAVRQMKLAKDRTAIIYNEFLTLAGIPEAAFQYRLGNRSALEWLIDQYRVGADSRSGIEQDPNLPEDPEYIIRLIGKVVTVSLETVKLCESLTGGEDEPWRKHGLGPGAP